MKISDIVPELAPIPPEQVKSYLQDVSIFDRVYLYYIKSYTHHHELESIENNLLIVKPTAWAKKFSYAILLISLVFGAAIGLLNGQGVGKLYIFFFLSPLLVLGIPTLLGGLYFQWCIGKIKSGLR